VEFQDELQSVLPADLPHRDSVIAGCARHLAMIVEVNKVMNLTRILSPREAAIKHVLDSVLPWRLFEAAGSVLDSGTGAGFPGIPLALVLPETKFILAESIGKKARFVSEAVETLGLRNVQVRPERAESLQPPDVITARAMAPVSKIIDLFKPAMKAGTRLLLYKGPDVEEDKRARIDVVMRYELPDDMGTRTVLEVKLK